MTVGHLAGQREGLSFLTEIPLGRLTSFAKPRQFPEGSEISDGSELSEAAWFILSGSCEIRRSQADGSHEVLTSFVPGEAFGNCAHPSTENGRISAMATSDSVLLCFDRTTLQLLRTENALSHGNANGNGNGHHGNGGNGHNAGNGYHGLVK